MSSFNKSNVANQINVAAYLRRMGRMQPFKRAVCYPAGRDNKGRAAYSHLTFLQLEQESDCIAYGLEKAGILRGTRTILMVKPSLEFFLLTFALFKVGAVPVVVDPGMGIQRMLQCLQESNPQAFIGIPIAHVLRIIYSKFFKTIHTYVTVGNKWFWGGHTFDQIRQLPWKPYTIASTTADDMAAILFTTGSTGPAKGAVYTHKIFDAQIRHIRSHFEISPDEIDLPTFPLFALFDPALGMTAVLPDMDPTKPGSVDPENIIEPILNQGVTNMFASPALLHRVGQYGKERGIKLPSLKRVVSAGAPVAPSNIETFATMLRQDAEIHTPYGATEAVPVISIASKEILSETKSLSEQGFGNCIGLPLKDIEARIIKIRDTPIRTWSDDLLVSDGEIGEIVVSGDLVTQRYYNKPEADALAKIQDRGNFWHRMGDLGWKDKKGRYWFCGRKSHRVITEKATLFTIPCEAVFNNHPRVRRSALVGIGEPPNQTPVVCIELEEFNTKEDLTDIEKELLQIAENSEQTKRIKTILFHQRFPVDIRHNSKIFREQLAVWAKKQLSKKIGIFGRITKGL
jgi:acyl-coenzyme A synthetase/AMP-(fatty) acid ligase